MALKRIYIWLLAAAMLLLSGVGARAQNSPEGALLDQFDEPFGFVDPYPYRGYRRPNQGWFFNFDQLYWSFSKPTWTQIGQPDLHPIVVEAGGYHFAQNSMDTSWMGTDFTHGQRYEFGDQGHHWGWFVSGFTLRSQTQEQAAGDVEVVFNDSQQFIPGFGPIGFLESFLNRYPFDPNVPSLDNDLNGNGIFGRYFDGDGDGNVDPTNPADNLPPEFWDRGDLMRIAVTFDEVRAYHRQQMWSTEFMGKYRFDPTHHFSNWELTLGVRYLNFKDRFRVQGWGGVFDDSVWDTNAINNLVGPQIGAHWFRYRGRLSFSVEPRFMAAWNFQSVRQYTRLASQAPDYLGSPIDVNGQLINNIASLPIVEVLPRTWTHGFHSAIFAPVGELRVNVGYRLFNSITLRAGWTGLVMGNMARATNMVDYSLPGMGIKTDTNRQTIFVQGYNLGVEVNY